LASYACLVLNYATFGLKATENSWQLAAMTSL